MADSAIKSFTTPPDDGDFAWVNQGSATTSTTDEGWIYLSTPVTGGDNYRIRKKTIPSAPYTFTAAWLPLWGISGGFPMAGIGLRDSGTDKLVSFLTYFTSSRDLSIAISYMNSATSYNSSPSGAFGSNFLSGLNFFRITDDTTNRKFYYSKDGHNFSLFCSTTNTDFLTPNELFFFVSSYGTSGDVCGMTLFSWEEA